MSAVREKVRLPAAKSSRSLVATSLRRLTDPWPAPDGAADIEWAEDDWPVVAEDFYAPCFDPYYEAWLDYVDPAGVDPAEFLEEVHNVDL